MFPEELSTGLCSLKPHVDRLVQSCLMEVDRRTGMVVRHEMHDGVIHSDARMTYTEVSQILTDRDPAMMAKYEALVPMFERMHALFEILHQRRRRRGSVDFDLKESEIRFGDDGAMEAIVAAERNVAHRLIEEFMLLANETVAEHLETRKVPTLYRIHETPDPLKVERFEEFIGALGYSLSGPADHLEPRHFQKLVEKIHGKRRKSRSRCSCCGRCRRRGTTLNRWATSGWPRPTTHTSRLPFAGTRIWWCIARFGNRGAASQRSGAPI
jgi:ribonuclease R